MNIQTKERLSSGMRAYIAEAVRNILEDPDFGFELSDEAKRRLKRAQQSRRKRISFSEIKKTYS